MNARGREVLVAAALRGQKQARGRFKGPDGGRCGLGVLLNSLRCTWGDLPSAYGLQDSAACPECTNGEMMTEISLIAHLNDYHGFDFLAIANKMPVTDEP